MSALLDMAIAAHGGIERWRALSNVTATVSMRGALFHHKVHREDLGQFQATADTATPRLVSSPFVGWRRGVWQPARVAVESDAGIPAQQREDPRTAFGGLVWESRWDELHLLYFIGYAMWNYLCTPFMFTLPGFETDEIDPWVSGGERWRRLHVRFPRSVPTHCDEQVFYFDDNGLLRRLDYTAEVTGNPTPAAHYCHDHRTFDGLVVPTHRRVYARRPDGTVAASPPFIELDVTHVAASAIEKAGYDG